MTNITNWEIENSWKSPSSPRART